MRKYGKRVSHAKPKRGIGFTQKLSIPGEMIWDAQKPRYNGWQTGHGPHKSAKAYDRNREKSRLREELDS